ncbi:MAG TPA: MBL fold metallo-hydrolase [Candidatus Binatia bacterium]|jgi:glyoxylase-like metal-dependent hydrolase (beta-lactamase superfamily II)
MNMTAGGIVTAIALLGVITSGSAQAQSAQGLIGEAAKAMGGMAALRAIKNQIVESEGKQFDSSSTPRPLGPTRQIGTFRYTLTRELTQPRIRLEWENHNSARNEAIRFVEVIDGTAGLLQEGEAQTAKQSRLHPGRLATRSREEKRAPISLILSATASKTLRRLADADLDSGKYQVVSFKEGADEFRIYFDPKTHLPAQTDILEDDPLEGDSNDLLRYGDWRKVDKILLPFNLRYELNGKLLQEEQIKSVQNNVPLVADPFAFPQAIRNEKTNVTPIASQWILRRVAGNFSYQDLGRPASIEWRQLADGVHKIGGSSHATIVIEMRDYLVAVEGPLYEARTAPVVKAIKERFPGKPIRYVIPTHHHLDHAGGIRAFMAEGAIVVSPFNAREFYIRVAQAPHTRQPDSLEKTRTPVVIESFGGGPRVLTDGVRTVEVYPLPTSHAEDLVVVYLPAEKIVIEADHISPRNGQVRSAPAVKEFIEGLDRLNFDVATIVGIHGDSAPIQAARAAAQGGAR